MIMMHRQTTKPHSDRKDWRNLKRLFPFVWEFKGRVVIALACLVLSKLAVVGMPLVLRDIIDGLDSENGAIVLPIMLLLTYGALRLVSLSLIHISEPTRQDTRSRIPSSA